MIEPAELMRLAIEKTREGIEAGQSPFGCAIALGDLVIVAHNVVWATTDITAHAEVNALRIACKKANQILLEGAIVAATTEPCPMCMSALHWARVETVYYGASIADATKAGFNELAIPATEIVRIGGSPVNLVPNFLRDEAVVLFDEFIKCAKAKVY